MSAGHPSDRVRALWLACIVLAACPEADAPPDAGARPTVEAGTTAKTASALLEAAKGQVTLERGGKKSPAQLGYLYVGDALETGEDSEATVRFSGGRVVELGPDGRFELKEGESGLVLSVAQGLVLTSNATNAPAQPLPGPSVLLTILTPFGFTKVGADPIALTLTVNDKGASVDVKLGLVDLVANDGRVTKIGAGQKGAIGGEAGQVIELEPMQIALTAAGKSELKRKTDSQWSAVGKKSVPLAEGDSFRVKDGTVLLQAAGGRGTLQFARGSEATMGRAGRSATAEEAGLDFKKGELTHRSPMKSRLDLGGGVSVSSDGASQYTLKRTKDGYELVSIAGDVKIDREGAEAATVFGGRTATIPLKGAVKSQEPPRETLTLPSRTALKVLQNQPGRLAIVWEGEPEAPYRVEVSGDAAFAQKLLSGVVHQRHVNVQPPVRGSLYWRVFDAADKQIAKGSASFAPEPSATDLAHGRNEVQDGAEQTTIFFQDKPPAVTFRWEPNAEAAKYKVQVYEKGKLSTPVAEKVVTEGRVSLAEGALGEGSYLWSLKYLDKNGGEVGGTGKMNKLVITYDNAVPNLTIKAPKNGDAGGAKVRCQGVAPVGAKLQINGKPVSLDEKSRFDTEVAPLGAGLLVFRMQNGASEVYTVRKVRRVK
ncbi:MAG: hypothetical protein JNK82_02215 [Myxococcaceae bacterium]|nr:hypothetical protein [Myxococcaceae bacterium]